MGLAVYNSTILDIHFPPVCYRKLLSPAVVPYNMPKATVGVTKVTLADLSLVFPVSFMLQLVFVCLYVCVFAQKHLATDQKLM